MATLDIGGSNMFYSESGAGKPVVLAHGIPTDFRAWKAQVPEFSKKYRTVAYSRRYASPNVREGDVSDSTVQNNADDLKKLIRALGPDPVSLVGHSYGGFVAAYLAANEPGLVRSLVLVEPAVSTMLVKNPNNPLELLALLLGSPAVASSVSGFRSKSLNPALKALGEGRLDSSVELLSDGIQGEKASLGRLSEETQKMMKDNARTIAELKTAFPVFTKSDCARIKCRTLVLNGGQSPLWLRRIGFLLAGSIQGARAVSVRDAHHFPHIENPGEFNSLVLGFLGEES